MEKIYPFPIVLQMETMNYERVGVLVACCEVMYNDNYEVMTSKQGATT